MGLFDQFPYTNFHELNLMWILEALKEIQTTTEQFVAINSLKYANPIQWNITSQYEKNTIVIDPQTGTAYISVQPVPTGVTLTNEDYWTVVFNLGSFVTRAAKNFTSRWEEDTTLTATFNTTAGQWLVWGDTLYRAAVNITAGDTYTVDSNIIRITIEEIKDDIYSYFNGKIGNLTALTTINKDNIVAAINEIVTTIANEAQTRSAADTALQTAIDNEALARGTADSALQTAIDNEAQTRSAEVAALNQRIDNIHPIASWMDGKKIYVFGDSLSNLSSLSQDTMWDKLRELLPDLDITINATPGITMSQINSNIASSSLSDADIIFIQGGTNDWTTNVAMATTYTQTKSAIQNAIQNSNNGAQVITIAPPFSYYDSFTDFTNTKYSKISDYGTAIKMASNEFNVPCLDLYTLTSCNELNYTKKLHMSGGASYVHPNDDFCMEIANLIIDQVYNNNCRPLIGKLETGSNGSASTAIIGIDPDTGSLLHTGTFITSAAIAQNDNIGDLHCPVGTINSSIVHGVVQAPVVFTAYNQTAGDFIRCRMNYAADSSSLQLISSATIAAGSQIIF